MARRSQRTGAAAAEAAAAVDAESGRGEEHLVVVRVAGEAVQFRLGDIAEIIRVPRLAFMPLAPPSLLGLANLRGLVFPVVSLRRLLGLAVLPLDDAARVVLVDDGAPVGFAVDRIATLMAVPAARIERNGAGAGRLARDLLHGVVPGRDGQGDIGILNLQQVLRGEFNDLAVAKARTAPRAAPAAQRPEQPVEPRRQLSLLSFDLGMQEYALPLDCVREIVPLPEHVSEVASAENAVLGVVSLRDRLLPLVSLRALLGLPAAGDRAGRGKVVVLSLGTGCVGVVADRTREILRVDPAFVDRAPALLTRGAGDAEIDSICRLDDGGRLVAVLSPDRLFRSDLMRRILSGADDDGARPDGETVGRAMADEQFIIFRLGDQEYGLPVAAVDEVTRPPERITRLPKAPAFIDGVINLRGSVVPLVDLRRRFDIASPEPGGGRRILVLAVGGGLTGFVVDGVSEVLKVPEEAIRPAPELSSEQMRLIGRVANLEGQDRLILLVDPEQLFDRVEADVLTKFGRTTQAEVLNVS